MVIMLLLLAATLAANALLGPLGLGLIEWRVSENGLNQTYGADAAILALVVPATLAAAWLWWRGHRLGAPLALGAGLAALYYGIAETLGPDYIRYQGNNERYFLLFLAVITLGWLIAARAWGALDPAPPRPPIWLARGLAVALGLGAALISVAWLVQLVDIAVSGATTQEYLEAPSAFWTVRIVDLGFIAPVCFGVAFGLWRGNAVAIKAAYGVVAFMVLQATAVLAMGGVMLWRDDPTASPALVYALAPITAALLACALALLRSYSRDVVPGGAARHAPVGA